MGVRVKIDCKLPVMHYFCFTSILFLSYFTLFGSPKAETVCGILSPCDTVDCTKLIEMNERQKSGLTRIRLEKYGNRTEIVLDCSLSKKSIRMGDSAYRVFKQENCLIHQDSIRKLLKGVNQGRYVRICCDSKDLEDLNFDQGHISVTLDSKAYETGFQCEGKQGGDVDTSANSRVFNVFEEIERYSEKHLLKKQPRKQDPHK